MAPAFGKWSVAVNDTVAGEIGHAVAPGAFTLDEFTSGVTDGGPTLLRCQQFQQRADQVIAVGTCAISGGLTDLGGRREVREVFLAQEERLHLPDLLPRCRPIDTVVDIDLYLPGCYLRSLQVFLFLVPLLVLVLFLFVSFLFNISLLHTMPLS